MYIKSTQIEFDSEIRAKTLAERGLDFSRDGEVFAGKQFTRQDVRAEYGEPRFFTAGILDGRTVIVVWTPRGDARRIISMRRANEREQARYAQHLG